MFIWILVALCMIFGIILMVIDFKYEEEGIGHAIGMFFTSFVASVPIACVILFTVISICRCFCTVEEHSYPQYEIQGLEIKDGINGEIHSSFILGCGSTNGKLSNESNYYFFSINDYGKKLESLNAKGNVYIRETDDEKPHLEIVYKEKYFSGWMEKLFWRTQETEEVGKILVVPTDTIKIEYNVDI